ncbi:MAG: SGNH/GDSL hydrolase family protein [Acidobacteria bacterium]|nr:SGNH/GDSL hydrolase family protein [Acidobacteriota bacterium]
MAVSHSRGTFSFEDKTMPDIARIIALGASNLTRGFHTIVSASRSAWGPEVQVLAALGHGRSYGSSSRIAFRTLPGILESGLWRTLESLPPVPTRALITDVGNDILYGYSAERILAWIEETLGRLRRITSDIVLTDLPLASIRRLPKTKFLFFRSILFPSCRLTPAEVLEAIEQVNAGLAKLAAANNVYFFRLNPAWYGFDPIHIRPSLWRSAWREIMDAPAAANPGGSSPLEGLRLYLMAPERMRIFGIERFKPQSGAALHQGGRVWLF